jgi:hypothetical protein
MTLKSVTVTPPPGGKTAEWTYNDQGQTVRFENAQRTGIWDFPMPAKIPEGGILVPLKVQAQVQYSNFAPFLRVGGQLVRNGRYCSGYQPCDTEVLGTYADSDPNTPEGQSNQATFDLKLEPVAGTYPVEAGVSDGPKFQYTYQSDPGPQATATPTATATATATPAPTKPKFVGCRRRALASAAGFGAGPLSAWASAVNEVRVVAVQPGADYHKAGTPEDSWCTIEKDTVLQQGDEISVDPDGAVTLQFADNSTTVVKNTTQLKIASYFTEGGVVKTEILLKMGEVAAQVHKSEATKSDFRIKPPTAVASVRGTKFSVNYDPGSKRALYAVTEGVVAVQPNGRKEVLVTAGKEVMQEGLKLGKVVKLGRAGRRGGVSPVVALARVMKLVAAADEACGVEVALNNGYSTKKAKGGWTVAIKLVGRRTGTAKWTVRGRRIKASGALAKAIAKRCS